MNGIEDLIKKAVNADKYLGQLDATINHAALLQAALMRLAMKASNDDPHKATEQYFEWVEAAKKEIVSIGVNRESILEALGIEELHPDLTPHP